MNNIILLNPHFSCTFECTYHYIYAFTEGTYGTVEQNSRMVRFES